MNSKLVNFRNMVVVLAGGGGSEQNILLQSSGHHCVLDEENGRGTASNSLEGVCALWLGNALSPVLSNQSDDLYS